MQPQGYDLIMVTETGWESSRDWSAAIHGSTGQNSKEGVLPFNVREQSMHGALHRDG